MGISKPSVISAACVAALMLGAGASATRADTVNGGVASLPTPTGSQVVIAGNPTDSQGNSSGGAINYYSNQNVGQTFTTGTNADGYMLNSIAVWDQWEQGNGYTSGYVETMNVFQPTTGATSGPILYTGTATVGTAGVNKSWVVYTFSTPPQLQPNTLYAYSFDVNNGYSAIGLSVGNGSYSSTANPGTGTASSQLATFEIPNPNSTSTNPLPDIFTTTPTYWTGAAWGSNPAPAAVSATHDPTDVFTDNAEFQIIGTPATTPVPEPATVGLFALGSLAVVMLRRRNRV